MASGKNLDSYIEEAIDNIRNDRAIASSLLIDLTQHLKKDDNRHQHTGQVAAKYLEVLQRSNEQLVKVTALLNKREKGDQGLTSEDKEQLYDFIKEAQDE
tara:strand:+ start:324 stop:623 length:300 start_codon:yes stop_codon:yes gene_type:complete